MKLRIFVNPSRLRRWHMLLGDRLVAAGHQVAFAFAEGGPTLPFALDALISIERTIYRLPQDHAARRITPDFLSGLTGEMADPDFILDLTVIGAGQGQTRQGQTRQAAGPAPIPVLRLLFDGEPDAMRAMAAILDNRLPVLAFEIMGGDCLASGLPAVEKSHVLGKTLNDVFLRAITVVMKGLDNPLLGDLLPGRSASRGPPPCRKPELPQPSGVSSLDILRFGTSALFIRIAKKLHILPRDKAHWRIGWRKLCENSPPISDFHTFCLSDYNWHEDDGKRYFADPFVLERQDKTYIFCEELPFERGKAVISVFIIEADGWLSKPKVVLERPYHLSYPYIFERDGEVWMIPETSANRTVELYRAENFPDHWVLDQVLLRDVELSDVTLLEQDGKFWLFASDADGGISWDTLCLWQSDHFKGPWLPHPSNPLRIDASNARPAGAFIRHEDRLLRPVQDCTAGYGGALAFNTVKRLDEAAFVECELRTGAMDKPLRMQGVHTINRSQNFEVIDLLGRPGKCR